FRHRMRSFGANHYIGLSLPLLSRDAPAQPGPPVHGRVVKCLLREDEQRLTDRAGNALGCSRRPSLRPGAQARPRLPAKPPASGRSMARSMDVSLAWTVSAVRPSTRVMLTSSALTLW